MDRRIKEVELKFHSIMSFNSTVKLLSSVRLKSNFGGCLLDGSLCQICLNRFRSFRIATTSGRGGRGAIVGEAPAATISGGHKAPERYLDCFNFLMFKQ